MTKRLAKHDVVRRRILLPTSLLLLFGTAACATPARHDQPLDTPGRFDIMYRENGSQSNDVLPWDVDRVWSVVPAVFREIGFPAAAVTDRRDRVFITPHMEVLGRLYGQRVSLYIDCGDSRDVGRRADAYHVTFVIVTRVKPEGEGRTLVQTLIDGHARNRGTHGHSVPCHGTGRLEKEIAGLLQKRLSGPLAP